MKKFFNCIFIFLILSCIFLPYVNATSPEINTDNLSLHANCLLLLEKNTGDILYEKNAYEKMYPASTTKIMTAILVIENCYLNEVVTVSASSISAVPPTYSLSGLQVGEKLRIEDLLYILMIPSANDVANLLAEHTSGSVSAFSELMNKKANELGLSGTHYTNPSGVHDKDLYTTAYDLSILTRYVMKNKKFMEIVSTPKYTIPRTELHPEEDRTFYNSNLLLVNTEKDYYYPYATGIKTGFTDQAGDCLVASSKKDDVEFIAICLKGGRINNGLREKFIDCKTLFDFAFDNYTTHYKDLQEGSLKNNFKNSENLSTTSQSFNQDSEELDSLQSDNSSTKLILCIAATVVVFIIIILLLIWKRKKYTRLRHRR